MEVDSLVDSGIESPRGSVESVSTVDGSVESYLEIVQPDTTADSVVEGFLEDTPADSSVEGVLENMEAESISASSSVQADSASGSSMSAVNTSAPGNSMQPDSSIASGSVDQPESAPDSTKDCDMGSEDEEEERDDIEQAVLKAMDVYSCLQHIYKFLNDSIEAQRYEQALRLCEEFMEYRFCINCFMSKLYIINVHHAFYEKKDVFPDCIRNFLQLSETKQLAPSHLCCSSEASETS